MIRIRDIALPPEHNPMQLTYEAAKLLKISSSKIRSVQIFRRSVDARKKPDIRIVYTLDVCVDGNEERILRASRCKRACLAKDAYYRPPKQIQPHCARPVVVGFGPAGMFAALLLAMAGLRPLVLERGDDAQTRHRKVSHFFQTGELDPQCNVQFGEGGAGTFSDGKLNTGVNNPRIAWILGQFAEAGAREDVLYDAKPHVGTDVLLTVVQNIRKKILSLGGEIRFGAHVTGIQQANRRLTGLTLADGESIACSQAIFAIGHSARDTFHMLLDSGVPMEAKPFAMGVRIEHLQSEINSAQYGTDHADLPPADYKLVSHGKERTAYTFCMCPGGYVVAAASEPGGVVTNGMSLADRDGKNANSALLVTVNPSDFPEPGPLGGMLWQQEIEHRAFLAAGGNYCAPAQRLGDFLLDRSSSGPGLVEPTYRPGVYWCNLRNILPPCISDSIAEEILRMDCRLPGFANPDAVLTGPETRSSSPVRILRGENRQSDLIGLYPCGEGAGYAGGIMSAAIDGMLTAEAIIRQEVEKNG